MLADVGQQLILPLEIATTNLRPGDTETVSLPPQDSITMCKFSSRTETVIDDITYAVLTLHSPASPAEGSYANMQPRESSDQPHPQTEDVEYSSIVF
ncbi:UNVERIFIED_CONTAM: hypothetical protein FKN15_072434 [Acipenser sinensis]